ncbi:MAG: hypothetical protein KC425_08345, partial [Anaerolineales bacterium]|nr:hypothetical protein [Anaerolineales bacterium]
MSIRRLFVLLFVAALFAMGVRETLDPDMWWHLRTGESILQHGIPRQDVFSFTVPHHAWVTHEWLAQVCMWLVYQAAGLPSLIVVFAALIALTYWLLYVTCEGRPFLAAFVVLLAAMASAIVWGARPQIFNLLLTALFVLILERVRRGQWPARWLWSLPLLTLLWANLHSGYLLGVVLVGTYAVGEAAQRLLWPRDARARPWRLIAQLSGVALVSFLAAALNPNGVALWTYPFETLSSPSMQAFIQEWHPPDFNLRIFWPFAALLGLGVLSFVFSPRRPTAAELLLFGGTAWAALTSARNVPLFAIIVTPIIVRHLLLALPGARLAVWAGGRQPEAPLPPRLR